MLIWKNILENLEIEKVNEYYMEQNLIDNSNANILILDELLNLIENIDKEDVD